MLGWQTLVTSIAFQAGTEIQGLLALNYDTYIFQRWHGTMFVIAIILFALVFNTWLASRLNLVEGVILVVHIFGFFCMLVPLWVLAPRTPSNVVWTSFHDGGWGNTGLSTLIGLITSVLPLLGADASGMFAHKKCVYPSSPHQEWLLTAFFLDLYQSTWRRKYKMRPKRCQEV